MHKKSVLNVIKNSLFFCPKKKCKKKRVLEAKKMRVFCPNTLKKRERDDNIRYTIGRDAFFVLRDDDDDDDAKRRPPPRFCPSSIVVIDFFLGRDDATPPRRARRPPFTTTPATRESASDGHRGRMFGLSIGRGEL